jgi:hypothetical protein
MKQDGRSALTLRLRDNLGDKTVQLTCRCLVSWVLLAPVPAHGCVIGVDGECALTTRIANFVVILIYDLQR